MTLPIIAVPRLHHARHRPNMDGDECLVDGRRGPESSSRCSSGGRAVGEYRERQTRRGRPARSGRRHVPTRANSAARRRGWRSARRYGPQRRRLEHRPRERYRGRSHRLLGIRPGRLEPGSSPNAPAGSYRRRRVTTRPSRAGFGMGDGNPTVGSESSGSGAAPIRVRRTAGSRSEAAVHLGGKHRRSTSTRMSPPRSGYAGFELMHYLGPRRSSVAKASIGGS